MKAATAPCLADRAWSADDIPYERIDHARLRHDGILLSIVATASFLEITSDAYTTTLADFFAEDADMVAWLTLTWQREELRHGLALKRYVEQAWPDFDWQAAYQDFHAEFLTFCSIAQLAPTRTLELAARCVIETGTAAFYRMLAKASPEPVLSALASAISQDEIGHYKYFYRGFLRYQAQEMPGRAAVARTLWSRSLEIDTEDLFYAYKHVHLARYRPSTFEAEDYRSFCAESRRFARPHFPHRMASEMLLKPLGLNVRLGQVLIPATSWAARTLLSH
jgi:rubrerythrin